MYISKVHATLDKLEILFMDHDIEKKERADYNWMRQYGRARAQQIHKLYKTFNWNVRPSTSTSHFHVNSISTNNICY